MDNLPAPPSPLPFLRSLMVNRKLNQPSLSLKFPMGNPRQLLPSLSLRSLTDNHKFRLQLSLKSAMDNLKHQPRSLCPLPSHKSATDNLKLLLLPPLLHQSPKVCDFGFVHSTFGLSKCLLLLLQSLMVNLKHQLQLLSSVRVSISRYHPSPDKTDANNISSLRWTAPSSYHCCPSLFVCCCRCSHLSNLRWTDPST